jgi:hypothetical protein
MITVVYGTGFDDAFQLANAAPDAFGQSIHGDLIM